MYRVFSFDIKKSTITAVPFPFPYSLVKMLCVKMLCVKMFSIYSFCLCITTGERERKKNPCSDSMIQTGLLNNQIVRTIQSYFIMITDQWLSKLTQGVTIS